MTDNVNQLNDIKEGAELNLAFKTEPGKKIVEGVMMSISDRLEQIVANPDLNADDILRIAYECRGICQSLGILGDKMTYATAMVAKRVVQGQLGRTG